MSDPLTAPQSTAPGTTAQPVEAPASPAVARFKSCRWRRPPEEGPECCGHRDVLPMAGTQGFVELPPQAEPFPEGFIAQLYRW